MNKLILSFVLIVGVGNAYALPPCPTSGYFDNCFGAFKYADGSESVGEWKGDKLHGFGTYLEPNGNKYVGEFRDDQIWTGFLYDSDGNVLSEYLLDKLVTVKKIEKKARPAAAYVSLTLGYLKRLHAGGNDVFAARLESTGIARQLRIFRAVITGRV